MTFKFFSKIAIFTCCMLNFALAKAQFAPQAGIAGSEAISKNSTTITGWANGCRIRRGLQQIDSAAAGYAQSGDSSLALGRADGNVVSLGDSGIAVLTFASPIIDGPGADFAVFENGFLNPANPEEAFLELAFVEVSSDGAHFFRFPATSMTQPTSQLSSVIGLDYMNARLLNNLAGKYIGGFGTPFDLHELADTIGLDIDHITHIRVIDVIGSIGAHGSLDDSGNKINDPFPTMFPTGGFDLDAVGVLHQLTPSGMATPHNADLVLYPNPVTDQLLVGAPIGTFIQLSDAAGRVLLVRQAVQESTQLSLGNFSPGIYYIITQDEKGNRWTGKVFRQ